MSEPIALNLAVNQFLKIRATRHCIDFEIIEFNKGLRPKRWHVEVPTMEITNRHTKESKQRRLNEVLWALDIALKKYFSF